VDTDPDAVRAQLTATGKAIPAFSAHDVALGPHDFSRINRRHAFAQLNDLADEFVADDEGRPDGVLGPLVPALDVKVGAADAGTEDPDKNFAWARFGIRDILQPQPGPRLRFDQRLHCGKDTGLE
jgi:hypothetical protein